MVFPETRDAYLGSHELWCATEGTRCAAIPHLLLAQTVIGDLDMPVQGKQNVVELQISVNDAVLMEVFQCQADFCGVEPGLLQLNSFSRGNIRLTALSSIRTGPFGYVT